MLEAAEASRRLTRRIRGHGVLQGYLSFYRMIYFVLKSMGDTLLLNLAQIALDLLNHQAQ